MAAVDYGTVIFKNGRRYKADELFPIIDELDLYFYKHLMMHDGQSWGFLDDPRKKAHHLSFDGIKCKVNEIARGVYKATIFGGGDRYSVVFGYGIDPDADLWEKFVKPRYYSKRDARKVSNVLRRLGYYD